jgi:hypothetical protein
VFDNIRLSHLARDSPLWTRSSTASHLVHTLRSSLWLAGSCRLTAGYPPFLPLGLLHRTQEENRPSANTRAGRTCSLLLTVNQSG